MRVSACALLGLAASATALPNLQKRQSGQAQFEQGQPISADGKGGPILGMVHSVHEDQQIS